MPTYQYACKECDHQFETVQSFNEDSLTDCPQCAGRLRKLFGSVGVIFKGSGFYRTDSRSGSSTPAKSESQNGSGEKKSESPAASSSDKSTAKDSSSSSSSTSSSSSSSSPVSTSATAKAS